MNSTKTSLGFMHGEVVHMQMWIFGLSTISVTCVGFINLLKFSSNSTITIVLIRMPLL